jgi:hypothetical protein
VADYCYSPDTLTLAVGSTTLDLMSDQQGFRVSALDLGFPAVREVVVDNSDRNGATDLTKLLGPRPVVITGALVPSPVGSRQRAWHALAPFLDPSARVTMTYRVDGDAVVKTMTLRAAQATATFDNPATSPAQLGFKAADPLAYDVNSQTAIAGVAGVGAAGRAYSLAFNRLYPAAAGSATVITASAGDFTVYPVLRFYGPMTNISLAWTPFPPNVQQAFQFVPSYVISAGNYVQVDCRARTAYLNGDPTNNVYAQLVAFNVWPYLPAGGSTTWALSATGYSSATQVQITWADAYLV